MSDSGITINGPRNPNVLPGEGEASITLYGYIPSLALGIVGVICFIMIILPNIWYLFKSGRRYLTFHLCLIIGCLVEAAGYAARIHSHYNSFRIDNFVAQFLLIILAAPILYTASIDLTLNILVKGFPGSDGILLLRPRAVLIVFVTLDAICNIVQIAGGTLFGISQSGDPSEGDSNINPELGQNVLKAGLALQVASWIIFIAFLGVAIWRANRTSRNRHLAERRYDPLRWYLWVVLVACVLIFWRACFRLAESVTGFVSGPLTREDYFGCFEFLPIVLCVAILTALPPYRFIEHSRTRAPSKGEKRLGPRSDEVGTPRPLAV